MPVTTLLWAETALRIMKKIWINKADSFEAAERFNEDYYLVMTETERLETVQLLREAYFKMKSPERESRDESRKGLRRFIKVVK